MLQRFHERAPGYDRENKFFQENFEELRDAGYLKIAVPTEFGGMGLNLAQTMREQRKLAYHAPATAVAVNMHIYWTGLCADLYRVGDESVKWLLEEAGDGEIFAAGHAESDNDMPLLFSTTNATPVDGGYKIEGRKSFGTLTPVWTRLGFHAMDSTDPDAPKVVHGFLPRDSEGYHIEETWDALGMRATRSDDTVFEGCVAPTEKIARVLPAGPAGMDLFALGIFAWALGGFSSVYYSIARRVVDLTVENLPKKTSLALPSSTYAHHLEYQHGLAEMIFKIDPLLPHVESVLEGYSEAVLNALNWTEADPPHWASAVISLKKTVIERSFEIADLGVELAGGFGVARKSEFERLFRDARMGRIHPAASPLAYEFVSNFALGGVGFGDRRWG